MDDTSFTLTGPLRVLHQAGIRYLLPAAPKPVPPVAADAPATQERTPAPVAIPAAPFESPWTDFLAKVPPQPVLLFTYAELGDDLSGGGSTQRSALWRQIIGALGLPRGSVGFWPSRAPGAEGEGAPAVAPQFAEGLRRIGPRVLVDFGSSQAHCLREAVDAVNASGQVFISYYPAPSPGELLQGGPDLCNSVARSLLALVQPD